jgi:hypothetical protein
MHAKVRFALPLLPVLLVGCSHEPVSSLGGPPEVRSSAGLMEITITGIGTPQQRASARSVVAEPGGALVSPSATRWSGRAATADAGRLAITGDGTIQIKPISTGSFTYGTRQNGYRYVFATYAVRNASNALPNTPYGSARTNLTMLAVNGSGTFATKSGTGIKLLARFNGDTTNLGAVALQTRPTGWAELSGRATITTRAPDVLQLYTQAEVGALTPPGGVTSILPYGFVVSNSSTPTSRRLDAIGVNDSTYSGMVTFAYKVPLQAAAADDPYTITAVFLPVDDTEVWVTQSLEDSDASSVALTAARAANLTAGIRSLIGSWVSIRPATFMCTARMAGTAGSPTAFLADTIAVSSVSPGAGSTIASNAVLQANFSQIMNGALASYSSFAVNGSQSGRAFRTGSFTGGGTATLQSPAGAFLAGEEVVVALTPKLLGSAVAGARVCPYVYQYRTAAGIASGSFTLGTPVAAVDSAPQAIAVGDFNEDGKLDVVVANSQLKAYGYYTVAVLKGDGLGGFSFVDTTGIGGSHPYGVAVGDLNGDGHLDVVATAFDNATVARLLGDGTGSFPNVVDYPVGANGPIGVAVGDLNGDGNLDVVTANFDGTVSVLLGDGTGVLTPAIGSPITTGGSGTIAVAIGDVNKDRRMDIVAANLGSSNVTVLLGDGTGRFTAGTPITVNGPPQGVALGDFNNDGNLDIATANTTANNVTVLLGLGTGGFTAATGGPFGTANTPMSIAVGDLDGSGNLDIVTADSSGDQVSVLLGNGSGGFGAASNISMGAGTHPAAVALGAFTTLGKLAIVTANAKTNNVTILIR